MCKKRNRLAPKKVEELLVTKQNKSQIEKFKVKTDYEIKMNIKNPFRAITVLQVIANLL